VDELGYIYVADTGNQRVVRFQASTEYIQRVNVKTAGLPLTEPTVVAADTSLVYVGDPKTSRVIRYERLP